MSGSLSWKVVLGLAGLLLVGGSAVGRRGRPAPLRPIPQPPAPSQAVPALTISAPATPNLFGYAINPNPFIAPGVTLGQAAFNTAVMGMAMSQVPPFAFGSNPFMTGSLSTVPTLAGGGLGGGFGLSTVGGVNPYLGGGAATLSTSPGGGYSMSTSPYSSAYSTPYGSYGSPLGADLQGAAALTSATGGYWKAIGQAQLIREQARQASIDTLRKQIEFEQWWDTVRPTAPKMLAAEKATDLDRARKDPPATELWSGQALNALLRSIQNSRLNRASSPSLEEDSLKNINLSDRSSRGNIGMLKDGGKLSWPASLQESQFDEARKRLSKNLRRAVDQVKNDKEPVEPALLKDISGDFKALNSTLNESADDLSPVQYIEARRYLNQLGGAIRALSDSKVTNYFNNTWNAKGKNVAELVSHMTREGLVFAPATPGDEAAYNALYVALRNYEAGLQATEK
jgi:hypothetical protein